MSTLDDDANRISTCGEMELKLSTWKIGVGSFMKQEDNLPLGMTEIMSASVKRVLFYIKRRDDGRRFTTKTSFYYYYFNFFIVPC